MAEPFSTQGILDGLGHGVLVFSEDNRLTFHNLMAGRILGADLNVIKTEGWDAVVGLFDAESLAEDDNLGAVRAQALQSDRPVRFRMLRSGEFIPCWASCIVDENGKVYTMLTLDVPDWGIVAEIIDRFRKEMRDSVNSTLGHIGLIERTMQVEDDDAARRIAKRIGGFTRLITIHMSRATRLMNMLERLEDLRTGKIHERVRAERRKIAFDDFIEDFLEELNEIEWLDPETEGGDFQARFHVEAPDDVALHASRRYLRYALRELLRNAIMYSLRGTPIYIRLHIKTQNQNVQIDVTDEGYGIRQKEWERIFSPFERARQPQIISEFGYGLNLYLCKHELQAMNGTMWFTTEEGVGTTFSMLIPMWRELDADASSSSEDRA